LKTDRYQVKFQDPIGFLLFFSICAAGTPLYSAKPNITAPQAQHHYAEGVTSLAAFHPKNRKIFGDPEFHPKNRKIFGDPDTRQTSLKKITFR